MADFLESRINNFALRRGCCFNWYCILMIMRCTLLFLGHFGAQGICCVIFAWFVSWVGSTRKDTGIVRTPNCCTRDLYTLLMPSMIPKTPALD